MAETGSAAACAGNTVAPEMLLPNDAYLLDHGIQEGKTDMRRPLSADGVGHAECDALHTPPVSMPPLALCEGIDAGNLACSSPKRRRIQAMSPRAADATVDTGGSVASVSCIPVESVEPSVCPEAELLSRNTSLASSRKGRLEPKPVQVQREGETGEWITIPSLAQAARETGVPNGSISHLCDVQATRGGWKFRWPNAEALPQAAQPNSLDASNLENLPGLAAQIRAAPAADRRAVVASLPEATRRALVEHLRGGKENAGSRVKTLIAQLPQLLPAAKPEERRALLQGVRDLQARQTALLAAPDVATVAAMLREVTPVQRRILVEGLPEGTQFALREHLLEEKNRANALKAATIESGGQGSSDGCTLEA